MLHRPVDTDHAVAGAARDRGCRWPNHDLRPGLLARPTVCQAAFSSRTAARLAEVSGLAEQRDRLMGRWVRLLIDIKGADDLAEVTGGMSLQVWLQHQGRCTHADARDLLAAADVLAHMPATVAGLAGRWLSWPQTLAIARAARKVPVRLRCELDQVVADAMTTHADWEPDALVHDVWQWIDAHQPSRLAKQQQAADRAEFVTLAPRLWGGGTVYGELGHQLCDGGGSPGRTPGITGRPA
jgi:hypothetical protein